MTTDRGRCTRCRPALQLATTFALTLALATTRDAAAGPPDPASSSIPQHILLVGTHDGTVDPSGVFNVHVADSDGANLEGITVTVDLTGAPDVELSSPQPVATFISCKQASAVTDNGGNAQFNLVGRVVNQVGNWSLVNNASFTAGSTPLGNATVACFDLDGIGGVSANDLHILHEYFFTATTSPWPVMDYNYSGQITPLDISLLVQKLFSDQSSDPLPTCSGNVPSGTIQVVASMTLLPSADCQTGAPTSYCAGARTDFMIKLGCPFCTFTKVTAMEASLTISSPASAGALPLFWRFDTCHHGGFQLLPTTTTGDGCLDNSPLYLDTGEGITLPAFGGWEAKYPNPATGLVNEEALRLVQVIGPAWYDGPGLPGQSGSCEFGYGTLPTIPGPLVPAFALRVLNNTSSCGACNTGPIKIKLNWVKLTRVQPVDWSRHRPQSQCAAPQAHPYAAFGSTDESIAWSSGEATDTSEVIVYPDGSGSNEITLSDTTTGVPLELARRGGAWLAPAVPNPTPDAVSISFGLPRAEWVRLMIVDVSGRIVRTLQSGELEPGVHRVTWDGRDQNGERARAGVYFCRLRIEGGPLSSMIVLSR